MEHFSSYLDLPVSDMQMKMVGHVQNNSGPQYLFVPNEQMGMVEPVEPVSSSSASETLMVPINRDGNNQVSGGSMVLNPIVMSNQLGADNANMLSREKPSFPFKRKAEVGPLLHNNSISQLSPLPSKRPAHTPVRSELASPGSQAQSSLNKKTVRNDSMTGKSAVQQGQNAKKHTIRTIPSSKSRPESSEAIRSKMRESLAAALELAFQKPECVSNTEKDKTDSVTDRMPVNLKASDSNVAVGGVGSASEVKESPAVYKRNDVNDLLSNESGVNGGKIFDEFQFGSFLPDEDVSFTDNFFAKDDLLQGNGLSWAFEFDNQMREAKHAQDAETFQPVKQEDYSHQPMKQEDSNEETKLTPSDLANKIESELFKLFGGANKKYKEKGRSLLFNLKDRNNPELRERVMSAEISPERLCSMPAEELASKELSEWRMAKAEEMAQMVVLPDTEVDVRRLVKKTHKGEYQVEFERDDVIVSEVSGGTSVLTRPPLPKKEETDVRYPPKESTGDKNMVVGQENGSGNQDISSSLIIQTDGTDFMQGIMVDEIKDPALLPPIVSLDEFMESLNAEPPFENIPEAEEAKNLLIHKESPKAVKAAGSPKDVTLKKADTNKREVGLVTKSIRTSPNQKVIASPPLKVEYIWQGKLQLNTASAVTVGGVFQSGEKTSTKEWSTSVEVKGKVKIDAFEKFLQDLPMSRTRAVMVLLIVLKDKTFDDDRANLSEAVNSYIEEQRLGYAEPAPCVELYLCPPTPKTTEMLNKHMPKHALPNNNSFENELIGVVVWRRAHLSNTVSPNSTSHHKHTSKKQSFSTPTTKRVQDSPNINVNTPNRTPPCINNVPRPNPEHQPDQDDDIPPGFGPVVAARANKDDDDLPEFNFSGHLNRPISQISPPSVTHGVKIPQQPVDQVRELIKKYGQSDTSAPSMNRSNNGTLSIEPWDDDDDIPEWRPEAPIQLHHPTLHAHRPPAHFFSNDRHMDPVVIRPLPGGSGQPQPGGRWPRPPGPLHGARWRPY